MIEIGKATFAGFLKSLGGLHDSAIEAVTWKPQDQSLEITFRDLYSNFKGLPEYPGPQAGTITLRNVASLEYAIDTKEPLHVDEFVVRDEQGKQRAKIAFWPSGMIAATFESAAFPESQLKTSVA